MIVINTYKLQGNGEDSWHVDTHDCELPEEATRENRLSRELVYEDPSVEAKIDISSADISTLNDEQVLELKDKLGL